MSSHMFVIVGHPTSGEPRHLDAVGPFRDQREAEDYIRDVVENIRFKYQLTWRPVPVSDPDIYRPRSADVAI